MLRRLGWVAAALLLAWSVRGVSRWQDRREVARRLSGAQAAYAAGKFDEAFYLVKLPSDRGIPAAQALHGRMLYKGQGTPERDYETAYRLIEPLAKAGDADSEFFLGMMNAQGQGRPHDYRAGYDWFMKAAAQGHDAAIANIGYLYQAGLGVKKSEATAYGWYLAAAKLGNKSALQKSKALRREITLTEVQDGEKVAAQVDAFIARPHP